MRMWNLEVKKMCRKHLLGEHVECHMFVGCLNKGKNIQGYLDKGLLEIHNLKERHDKLAKEIKNRGYKHNSKLSKFKTSKKGKIDINLNKIELGKRCKECDFNGK